MSEVVYVGSVDRGSYRVEVIADGGRAPLKRRSDLRNHSPTGFAWGYAGSGPAQLALAMLAYQFERYPEDRELGVRLAGDPQDPLKRTADALAERIHQRFKFAWVTRLDQARGFRVTDEDVRKILRELAGLDEPPQGALPGVA